jgi:DNA-binding NarL/FixJ family response regulator
MEQIKVAIIVAEPTFKRGLSLLLKEFEYVEVVAECFEAENLMKSKFTPDIIILDTATPINKGLETAKIIKNHYPDSKIIILTIYAELYLSRIVEGNKINGLLTKPVSLERLGNAIRVVASGNKYFIRNNS